MTPEHRQNRAILNNTVADTVLKLTQAAANLHSQGFVAEGKQVAEALVKLLPQEAQASDATAGETPEPKPAQAERRTGQRRNLTQEQLDEILAVFGVNPANVFISRRAS